MKPTHYPCMTMHDTVDLTPGGGPCAMTASLFAIDDRARLGHLCTQCWRKLPWDKKDLYAASDGSPNREPVSDGRVQGDSAPTSGSKIQHVAHGTREA